MNVNSTNRGESNLAIFSCVLKSVLINIRSITSLSLAQLRIGPLAAPCYYCYLLPCYYLSCYQTIYQNCFTSTCSETFAENHLSIPSAPRWVRHSYLSKGLQLIPYTCGSSRLFSGAIAWECSTLGKWNLVRKLLSYVLIFIYTCYYGK